MLCQQPRVKYAFVRDHQQEHSIQLMCHVFKIHRSGYYALLKKPLSNRAVEDLRLLECIKECHIASGGTYGSPWIHRDLRDEGESCSVHRVAKIMRNNSINALLMAVWQQKPKYEVLVH